MSGIGAVVKSFAKALEAAASSALEALRNASGAGRPKPKLIPIPIRVEDGRQRR
jgi:hypothetical protein